MEEREGGFLPGFDQHSGLSVPDELYDLKLYRRDQRLVRQWNELAEEWRRAYPDVDIMQEVSAAHSWEVDHPGQRKKKRSAFLGNWIRRAARNQRNGTRYQEEAPARRDFRKERDEWFRQESAGCGGVTKTEQTY